MAAPRQDDQLLQVGESPPPRPSTALESVPVYRARSSANRAAAAATSAKLCRTSWTVPPSPGRSRSFGSWRRLTADRSRRSRP